MMNNHATLFEMTKNNFRRLTYLAISTLFIFAAWQVASNFSSDDGPIMAYGLVGIGVLMLLTAYSLRHGRSDSNATKIALATMVVFVAMCVEWLNLLHDAAGNSSEDIGELSLGILRLAGGMLLWIQIGRRPFNALATRLVVIGLLIQVCLAGFDVSQEFFAGLRDGSGDFLEPAEQTGGILVVILYDLGLIGSFFVSPDTASALLIPIGVWLSKAFFNVEYSLIGARSSIAYHRLVFRIWKLAHSNETFANFYAWEITRKLDRGRAHRTLGKRRFEADSVFGGVSEHSSASFAEWNPKILKNQLLALGLKPGDSIVDYGCGSLRVGQHFIRYLEKDKYWGLDVTDRFFQDGLSMLGDDVIEAKAPTCKVITAQVLTEARNMRPDFLISIAVLKHVPKKYLDAYFDKVCYLVSENTTLVISFSESDIERQISGKSWSWSAERIERLVRERLPEATISIVFKRPQKSRNGVNLNLCLIAARPALSGSGALSSKDAP